MTDPTTTTETDHGGRPARSPRARGAVSSAERDRMRQLARDGASARGIARVVGRSPTTVSRLVGDLLADRRAQTAAATETRQLAGRARRAEQAERLLDDLDGARRMLAEQLDPQGAMWSARVLTSVVTAHARLVELDRADQRGDHNDVDAWHRYLLTGAATEQEIGDYMPLDDAQGPA